jgi:hypothetical protein
MLHSGNFFHLPCAICGMELTCYDVEKDEETRIGFNNNIEIGKKDLMKFGIKKVLVCHQDGKKYLLYEISPIKYEDLEIAKGLPEEIAAYLGMEINFRSLLSDPRVKAYQVVYSTGTKIQVDRLKVVTNRKPSPSNHILDDVRFYICAPVYLGDEKVKNILFAIVAQRKERKVNEFIYKIVWYEELRT